LGGNLLQGGIGEEKLWKKLNFIFLIVYATHQNLHSEFSLNGNIYSTQVQAASTSSFEPVL